MRILLRPCNEKGMKMRNARLGKDVRIAACPDLFLQRTAKSRKEALGRRHHRLHNPAPIQIGDTFTEGENLSFTRHPRTCAGTVPPVRLKRPAEIQATASGACRSWQRKARPRCSSPNTTTTSSSVRSACCSSIVVGQRLTRGIQVECA